MSVAQLFRAVLGLSDLEMLYEQARLTSEELGAPRSDGDATAQFMPEASPAKWHLAHTTWFFEAMVLSAHADDCEPFDERLSFLSSSYYETHDARSLVRGAA